MNMQETENHQLGLTEEEAKSRLVKDGPNEIRGTKKIPAILRFLAEFNDVLIYILLISGIISILLKEYTDAMIILFVVLMNGTIGFIQEEKANKSLEALKKITTQVATVKRNGKYKVIPASEIVVGDYVILEEGNAVPADGKILNCTNLLCDESALTGESKPVNKNHLKQSLDSTPLAERLDRVYMSTLVLQGHAEILITETGMRTEIGKIADMLDKHQKNETPLQRKLAVLGKWLGILTIFICLALFIIALIQKRNVVEMFITSISLAVAAVPEGLPAVVTIVLAIGVQRLIKSNMIIRKLHSVETLGAVNKILTDKTGTLTENQMTVVDVNYNLASYTLKELKATTELAMMSAIMMNCNNAKISTSKIGDPTEIALLMFSQYLIKPQKLIKLDEVAFTSERKMMSVLFKTKYNYVQYSKGALEVILAKCRYILINGQEKELTLELRNKQQQLAKKMTNKALRIIAFAYKKCEKISEEEMTFVGFAGLIDPPKKGVKEAILNLKQAGIDTIMITGDHIDTAFAIAKDLHIAENYEECIEGKQIDSLTSQELDEIIKHKKVYARVSPTHKIKLVEAYQKQNNLVAMTGDGVNDAPSLRKADVGIAMGKQGTDVAKNAADMILIDDNYASIAKAVKEGRGIYDNIKKTALFLLSSNFAEVLAMLIGVLFALPMPLVAVHILWVNLITDSLPALALGVDKTSDHVMEEKPRNPRSSLFAEGGYKVLFVYGGLITLITLISFFLVPLEVVVARHGFNWQVFQNVYNVLTQDTQILLKARTYAFTTLGISQLFHMIGMSDVKLHIHEIIKKKNIVLFVALFLGIFLQILVTEVPLFIEIFHTSSLNWKEWLFLILISAYPLVVHELMIKKK